LGTGVSTASGTEDGSQGRRRDQDIGAGGNGAGAIGGDSDGAERGGATRQYDRRRILGRSGGGCRAVGCIIDRGAGRIANRHRKRGGIGISARRRTEDRSRRQNGVAGGGDKTGDAAIDTDGLQDGVVGDRHGRGVEGRRRGRCATVGRVVDRGGTGAGDGHRLGTGVGAGSGGKHRSGRRCGRRRRVAVARGATHVLRANFIRIAGARGQPGISIAQAVRHGGHLGESRATIGRTIHQVTDVVAALLRLPGQADLRGRQGGCAQAGRS